MDDDDLMIVEAPPMGLFDNRPRHHRRLPSRTPTGNFPPPRDAAVIDLTELGDEPDVPQPALPWPPQLALPRQPGQNPNGPPAGRSFGIAIRRDGVIEALPAVPNPRRQPSANPRPPSLTRSDASMNGPRPPHARDQLVHAEVVDLTAINDDDDQDDDGVPPVRVSGRRPMSGPDFGQMFRRVAAAFSDREEIRRRHPHLNRMLPPRPNHLRPINLDYTQGAAAAAVPADNDPFWEPHQPQRPQLEYKPPPPAPEGFSRAMNDEIVAVCASCDDELTYDPDEAPENPEQPERKKPKNQTQKDRAQHHFMFVKACGHVFCRRCYENRKEFSQRNKGGQLGTFRCAPAGSGKKILCAVEDCNAEVGSKTSWLGVFV